MRLSHTIVLASTNPDKFREFQELLLAYPEIELKPIEGKVRNAGKLGFVENHETYLENAIAKARLASLASRYPALADDTGLEVLAMEGKPGVRSHRYAKPPVGSFGVSPAAQARANVELLLTEMKGKADRQARFVTSLALIIEGIVVHSEGTLDGTLTEASRGTGGFGYDSIFMPKGSSKTLAEMTDLEKNTVSHRAVAVRELMNHVRTRGIVFARP